MKPESFEPVTQDYTDFILQPFCTKRTVETRIRTQVQRHLGRTFPDATHSALRRRVDLFERNRAQARIRSAGGNKNLMRRQKIAGEGGAPARARSSGRVEEWLREINESAAISWRPWEWIHGPVLSANRTESLALLENGAHRSRKSTVEMRIENKWPDFDLVGRNEKHLPQFHNDKQRNT
jgi:hypothetical protein